MMNDKTKVTKDKFWKDLTESTENTGGEIILARDFEGRVGIVDITTGQEYKSILNDLIVTNSTKK